MKRVLVIEPGFYARVQLDDELTPYGFQVTAVKAVEQALIKMKTQIFNLLMVAYDDHEEDIRRMLLALRESFNYVPVVVLTKKPTEAQMVDLMRFRPLEIVVQPYALVDLVGRLNHLIAARAEQQK